MTKQQALKEQYNKELRRIKEQIRRMQNKGYGYTVALSLPERPKVITEGSIRRLQKIDSEYLYEHSTYTTKVTIVDIDTGEVIGEGSRTVSGKRARGWARTPAYKDRLENWIIYEVPKISDIIYERVKEIINDAINFISTAGNDYLAAVRDRAMNLNLLLERCIKENGKRNVMMSLNEYGEQVFSPLEQYIYESKQGVWLLYSSGWFRSLYRAFTGRNEHIAFRFEYGSDYIKRLYIENEETLYSDSDDPINI